MDRRQFFTLIAGLSGLSSIPVNAALSLNEVESGMKLSREGKVVNRSNDYLKIEKKIIKGCLSDFFGKGLEVFGKIVFPYQDNNAQEAIQSIYSLVIRSSTRTNLKWRIYIVDDNSLNAYTPGGGLTFVNTGLIRHCKTEAELASVLAHEVGHIEHKHAIRRLMSDEVLNQFKLSNKQEFIEIANERERMGQNVSAAIMMKISLEIFYKNFTRMWEHQADAFILKAFVDTGYDLNLASEFSKTLNKKYGSSTHGTCLYTSHPENIERISRIDAIAQTLSPTKRPRKGSDEFRYLKNKIGHIDV